MHIVENFTIFFENFDWILSFIFYIEYNFGKQSHSIKMFEENNKVVNNCFKFSFETMGKHNIQSVS